MGEATEREAMQEAGSSGGTSSEQINAALAAYSTPLAPPPRLALTPDERTELEQFRTMFGRLRLGPSTLETSLNAPTTFPSPADVSASAQLHDVSLDATISPALPTMMSAPAQAPAPDPAFAGYNYGSADVTLL